MKELRTLVLWSHLVLGLTAAIVLGLSGGAASVLHIVQAIERRLNTPPSVTGTPGAPDFTGIVRSVELSRAGGQVAHVDATHPGAVVVTLRDDAVLYVDGTTREIVGTRSRAARLAQGVERMVMAMHANLMLGSAGWKVLLIALAEFMLLALSGLWLWWRKKHWRFSATGSLFRISWDLHSASGIWAFGPVVVMTGTALLLAFSRWWMPVIGERASAPTDAPSMSVPAEAVSATTIGLERALALADSATSGRRATAVTIPRSDQAAYRVAMDRATVWVSQFTGDVAVQPIPEPTPGDDLHALLERIHTGEQFGIAGLVVMSLGSFLLAVMAATGLVLGWKRLQITLGGSRRTARDPA